MPTKSGDQEDAAYDGTGLRGQPGNEGQGRNDLHGGGEATGGKRQKPPRPDTIEPCPRCGSSDTKFCYYNNCNVKQPRFFCKTCQRYWTAGGTLRNVPPGSGRRKSKSQAAKESDKPGSLAEKLAKQSVASALLTNPAGLAASVPFLNPSLSAESAMLAYNAAAQQQLLGTAALNALSSLPGQWPSTGLTQAADSADGGTPSGNGGTNGQALGLSGEEQHDDSSAPSAKRPKLDSSRIKHEGDGTGGTGMSSLGLSATPAIPDTSTTAAANNMNDLNSNALLQSSQLMPGLRNGWPGLNANDHALLNGMGQGELSGMMGGQNAQQAAVAAQTALQQQHMAYQQMMHAQLLHQQLAAQAQVAAGLGQPNPYLSLQHLAAYNPGWSFPMGNPGLGHLGFNPQG